MILTTGAKAQILDKMAQLKSKKAKPFDFKPIIDLIKNQCKRKIFYEPICNS